MPLNKENQPNQTITRLFRHLNRFNDCHSTLKILFNITRLFRHLNRFKYCYATQTIQFNICLHTLIWSNSSILPIDGTLSGTRTHDQSGPGINSNVGAHSSKHYNKSVTLSLFSAISRTHVEGSYPSEKSQSVSSTTRGNCVVKRW